MGFIGALLILLLLLLSNGRVLFVKHEKRDALVILSPVSFVLCILLICAWGLDLISLYVLFLSILVLFSNFHALFRYSENLYVDHYSFLMKFWAVFTSILIILGILLCAYFLPISYSNKKLNISESKTEYEGGLRSEFTERRVFGKTNLIIKEFSPLPEYSKEDETEAEEETAKSPIILFVADKRAETEGYKNFLQLMANKGFTICSYDLYTDEIKWTKNEESESKIIRKNLLLAESLINSEAYSQRNNYFINNFKLELGMVIPVLEEKYGDQTKFFIITDEIAYSPAQIFAEYHEDKIAGVLNLAAFEEYTTKGYGFVNHNNFLVAAVLGEKRDYQGAVLKRVVDKVASEITFTE